MTHLWPYQTIGGRDNPPLIFLHGFMGRGADWLPVARLLASDFFCIMPDLPGHGDNTKLPIAQPLTFDMLAQELMQFLAQFELDQTALIGYSLIGYSMGGRIGLYTAITYPLKINALILESASPGIKAERDRIERARLDDQRAEALLAGDLDAFIEQWYQMPLFQSLQRVPHLLEDIKKKRTQNDPGWAARVISELSPGRQPALWDRLDILTMPVMLMAGALDIKYTDLVTKMSKKIPGSVAQIIPDAGHNVHLEQPEQFARSIKAFLTGKFGL